MVSQQVVILAIVSQLVRIVSQTIINQLVVRHQSRRVKPHINKDDELPRCSPFPTPHFYYPLTDDRYGDPSPHKALIRPIIANYPAHNAHDLTLLTLIPNKFVIITNNPSIIVQDPINPLIIGDYPLIIGITSYQSRLLTD